MSKEKYIRIFTWLSVVSNLFLFGYLLFDRISINRFYAYYPEYGVFFNPSYSKYLMIGGNFNTYHIPLWLFILLNIGILMLLSSLLFEIFSFFKSRPIHWRKLWLLALLFIVLCFVGYITFRVVHNVNIYPKQISPSLDCPACIL
jgi:hypothetical protein